MPKFEKGTNSKNITCDVRTIGYTQPSDQQNGIVPILYFQTITRHRCLNKAMGAINDQMIDNVFV